MPVVVSDSPSAAQVLRSELEQSDVLTAASAEAISRLLDSQQPLLLAHELFPRGPQVEELHLLESDFSVECGRYVEAVRHTEVLTDLSSEPWS
jgi:hypothetical protein